MRGSLIDKVLGWVDRSVQMLCVLCLATILVSVTWQVVSRYLTRSASSWTVDLASLAFVWLAMLAIAIGVRQGRHMVFDVWEFFGNKRWLNVLITTVASLLVILAAVSLTWYGFVALPSAMGRTMPGLGVPFGLVALAVPVGCALSAFFALEAWLRTVMNKNPEEDPLPGHVIFEDRDSLTVKGEI